MFDKVHEMLLEDEILFCGIMLAFGVVVGAAARCLASLRERRPT